MTHANLVAGIFGFFLGVIVVNLVWFLVTALAILVEKRNRWRYRR